MELLLLLLVIVIAFQAGKHWGYYKIVSLMKQVAEEQGIDLEKELGIVKEQEEDNNKPAVYKLEVETHGNVLYLFDKETDQFICQGSSVQELATLAKEYKNVLYAAVKYDDKVFAFKDGKSTEVLST